MLEAAQQRFHALLTVGHWTQELAGILPLSGLIDFLNVPLALHIYQLTKTVPLWCWPITPSGSRLLLSEAASDGSCCLDRYGTTTAPICLDGRYGDSYPMANPETLRLCLKTVKTTIISNNHQNMQRQDKRLQILEVIHVQRSTRCPQKKQPVHFYAASCLGWTLHFGLIALAATLACYVTLAYTMILLLTGWVVSIMYGGKPRQLRVEHGSKYNRLVVAALHMNETRWQAFYGESSVINSLLNWPLRNEQNSRSMLWASRLALRILILGQWALILGASVLKGWDAYFITFWILFCIIWQSHLFSPERRAKKWMEYFADVEMERYEVQLSSRRALLNCIIALNPDTFPIDSATGNGDYSAFYEGATKWIDPILKRDPDRASWEEATRLAMVEANSQATPFINSKGECMRKGPAVLQSAENEDKLHTTRYWFRFISEGMNVASEIRKEARFSERVIETSKKIGRTS
jgi:hypothetical protein